MIYDKSVLGIGFLGEGFQPNERKRQYQTWIGMLNRCYNPKEKLRFPTYISCSVCEEWHNFQNFTKWYDRNYYEIKDCHMQLDKDILVKGNKIYSPATCMFVPHNINSLFEKCYKIDRELPIGVSWAQDRKKYQSTCSNGFQKTIHLGYYDTSNQAFQVYKIYKENLTKQIADKYKDKIPVKLYDVMYNYKVEITD